MAEREEGPDGIAGVIRFGARRTMAQRGTEKSRVTLISGEPEL
jgi:hypothetical protein